MIEFHYEYDFKLKNEKEYSDWLKRVISSEQKQLNGLNFIFCSDDYLLDINQKYLNHDTYTDIISFDYSEGNLLQGDIFISIDRIKENALKFKVSFEEELRRVMVHGILHYSGYNDKTSEEKELMRNKEDNKINMFHVEQ